MNRYFFVCVFILLLSIQWVSGQWVVKSIIIENNRHTNDFVILRHLTFHVGDTLSERIIDSLIIQNQNNLKNTALFNIIQISTEKDSVLHSIQFIVYVEERWYLWPYPILEHADRNFSSFVYYGDWAKVNYGFFLVKYNFRGRQEILKAKFRKGYHEQYGLFYDKPYFKNHLRTGLGFQVALNRQHETVVAIRNNQPVYHRDTNPDTRYIYVRLLGHLYRTIYNTLSFSLGWNDYRVSPALINENPLYFGLPQTQLKYLSVSLSWSLNRCDIHYYPLAGYFLSAKFIHRGGWPDKRFLVQSILITGKRYWQKRRWSWAIFGEGYAANNHTSFFLQQGTGYYGHYLRGFEYFVINGNRYFLNKYFLRYKIFDKQHIVLTSLPLSKFNKTYLAVYGNVFFENGYVSTPHLTNTMQNTYLYSYGIGIDFVTYYDKVFRIDFSRNNFGYNGIYLHMSAPF